MPDNSTSEDNIKRSYSETIAIFMAKMVPWVILLVGLVVVGVIIVMMIISKQSAIEEMRKKEESLRKEMVANIKTWEVKTSTLVNDIHLPGVVQAWENLVLESEVTGKITDIEKSEGDSVKAGEIIAHIDPRDYLSALSKAKADLVLAKQNLNRTKSLKKQGAVPQSQLDSAQAEYDRAASALETAQHNLDRCTIKAPFSGIINNKYIAIGTLANPGSKIIELVDLSKVKIDIGIPENDFDKVRNLKEAEITVSSLGNRKFTGKKVFLSVKPIEQALVYTLQLSIENKEGLLVPGMFVDANIVREIIENAIVVPIFSVIARNDNTFCFVVNEEKAQQKDVELGIRKGRFVHIKSGLSVGDKLVVLGQRQIEHDQKVNVVEEINQIESLFK